MKKVFALVVTICMLATVFCVRSFAVDANSLDVPMDILTPSSANKVALKEAPDAEIPIVGVPDTGASPQDAGESRVGSVFGEGSLTMVISIVALIASVAAICVNVASNKNRTPAPKNEADEEK